MARIHARPPNVAARVYSRQARHKVAPPHYTPPHSLDRLTERFGRACRLLRLELDVGPVIVACSGGADSAAALLLLRRVAPKAKIVACYVNHRMRPQESIARDIAAVRAQARAARASVSIARATLEARTTGSPEERARVARYRVLEGIALRRGAALVITGHQQDDLAETSLLALARGSGIDGAAAMRPARKLSDSVTLARPLLWATKAQCRELVNSLRIPISEDETNADTRIPRNAVRGLLANLERDLPAARRGIARSAALLADDKKLLDWLSASAWERARLAESHDLSAAAMRTLPIALLRRVIRHAVAAGGAGLRNFSFEHCSAIAKAIKERRGGRYHAGAATVVLSSGKLVVETSRNQRPAAFHSIPVLLQDRPLKFTTPLGTASLKIHRRAPPVAKPGSNLKAHFLDSNALRAAGNIELRLPKTGDVCIPSGHARPVSLARYLGKAGVPQSRRDHVLLLCAGGRIAAVLGHRVMEPFMPKAKGPVLELDWLWADTQDTSGHVRAENVGSIRRGRF